ncbi:MAG TPA: Tad domain-containing protein [Clostridia bacterium]|nr:Tad domain-containing protein [Clostridia bacterium]
MILPKVLKNNRGSVVVIVCAAMVLLLGSMAVVTDLGRMAVAKSKLSNAVDAAALAGVQELPNAGATATEKAFKYAEANGIPRDEITVNLEGDSLIRVSGEQEINFLLAGILGINQGTVSASAAAVKGGVEAIHGASPFAVPQHNYSFGVEYELKQGAPNDGSLGPGKFGAIDFTDLEKGFGGGANAYRHFIRKGYSGELKVGDRLPLESGNMSGPTQQGIKTLFERCNHNCTPDNFHPGCPRILIVPVFDPDDVSGGKITIVGFGAFLVSKIPGSGNENTVRGCFLRTVPAPNCEFSIGSNQENYGLEGMKLVE